MKKGKTLAIGLTIVIVAAAFGTFALLAFTVEYFDFSKSSVDGNDSVTIQEAIDSLGPEGGTVILPAGTYTFYNVVSVPANVTIQGEGRDKTIIYNKVNYSAPCPGKFAFDTKGDNVRYTGMHIIGPPILYPYDGSIRYYDYEGYGIFMSYKTGIRIDHCEFNSFGMNAIYVDNSACLIDHNYIHTNYNSGAGYGVNVAGHANGKTFIEDNSFGFNRHDVASGGNAQWVARYNYIKSEATAGVQSSSLDAHRGNGIDALIVEWYNNIIEGDQTAGEPYCAFLIRGGSTSYIFNNTVKARDSLCCHCFLYEGSHCHSIVYYWDNDISEVWRNDIGYYQEEGTTVDWDIILDKPEGYEPDPYPHSLNDDPSHPIDGYGHFSSVGEGAISGTVTDKDTGNL